MVKEFGLSFGNHYIASGTHNNLAVNCPCENNLMKEDVFYDGIGCQCRSVAEASSLNQMFYWCVDIRHSDVWREIF